MRRHKRRRSQGDVELNLAAMLDMAFQLLTFFIFTFKPSPIEGQLSLRLPPPEPIAQVSQTQAPGDDPDAAPAAGQSTLVVSAFAAPDGRLALMRLGEGPVGGLAQLDSKLHEALHETGSPFDRIVVQVAPQLKYDELMQIVDVCSRQTSADGKPLNRLSFLEMSDSQVRAR
ncbi:MAG: biopolymer transporter ExbD [Pirellulales bacterium]